VTSEAVNKTRAGLPTKNCYVALSISRAYSKFVLVLLQRISLNKNITYKTPFLTRTPLCDTNLYLSIRLRRLALNQEQE
jgi:hypothetical protein